MTEAAKELNINDREYLRISYSFFKKPLYGTGGRKLTRSELALSGLIFALSDSKKNPDAMCKMSYSTFENKLNLSRGTIARGIGALKKSGRIVQDKSHKTCASYRLAEKVTEKGFIKIETDLFQVKFNVRGEANPRYLTDSEIQVLCLIKTHVLNEKGAGVFVGSVRRICETLNLNKNTVQKSIMTLLRANLIYREKGVNGNELSEFKINRRIFRKLEKGRSNQENAQEGRATGRNLTEAERAADARTERERYYSERRKIVLDRVEAFKARAMQDETFHAIAMDLNTLPKKMGEAEAFGRYAELRELQKKERYLKAQKAKRLALIGLTEADLEPQYICRKCEDTGFEIQSGRACSCYPKSGRRRP